MGSQEWAQPRVKVLMLAVLGIGLCAAPLVVAASNVGERVHQYESAEVVANDSSVWYESEDPDLYYKQISEEIACLGDYNKRVCELEEYALRRGGITVGSDVWPGPPVEGPELQRASYVQIDGRLYERTYPENQTTETVRFEHEPADGERVLRKVATDVESVPPEVAEAAREGEATSRNDVVVPESPVVTDDGTYYRVYQRNSDPVPRGDDWILWLAMLSPLGGLAVFIRLWRWTRISVEFG